MRLEIGSRLGPYEIAAHIGGGGLGEVYRARDTLFGREVNIRILSSAFSSDSEPRQRQRFEREAHAAAVLNHPNILVVHDIGELHGSPYIVSELVEGVSLRQRLNGGALPVRAAVDVAVQIAQGLAAAHERAIIHRDLKPENVLITGDGGVKILNFGISQLAEFATESIASTGPAFTAEISRTIVGRADYMSPEQRQGQEAGARSDIFALGAILYEMLTGQPAFRRGITADTIAAVIKEGPEDLNVAIARTLSGIVERCLANVPAERYASAAGVAKDLEKTQALLPTTAGEMIRRPPAALSRRTKIQPGRSSVVEAESATRFIQKDVYYGTNRKRTGSKNPNRFYGPLRDDRIHYGWCAVTIPASHKIAQIERPAWRKLQFKENPFKHIVLVAVRELERQRFLEALNQGLRRGGAMPNDVFVFIHGYNVSFVEGAHRTAQLAHDLDFQGMPILYSWPSKARLLSYMSDTQAAEAAALHLESFLEDIVLGAKPRMTHLVAHSRGNDALLKAVRELSGRFGFNEIILAAPDIDADVFAHLVPQVRSAATRVTLYVASNDHALRFSATLQGYPRTGSGVLLDGLDTIDASAVAAGLAHSYFCDARPVIDDIHSVIRGLPLDERRLQRQESKGGVYWTIPG